MNAAANESNESNETGETSRRPPKRRVWWLYTRVMIVQVVALVLLWLLQSTYGS